jgi:hypothetical protein
MDYDLVYSFLIGVTGATLFLLVDRFEPDRAVARLLEVLVLFVSSIIHGKIAPILDFAVLGAGDGGLSACTW